MRAEVEHQGCSFSGNHMGVAAGGSVTLRFEVAQPRDVPQLRLIISALVSLSTSSVGHAPVDVVFQGETLAWNLAVPRSEDEPYDSVFVLPERLLSAGTNTLEIRVHPEAHTVFWLHRLTVEAETAESLLKPRHTGEPGDNPVLAFHTECRPAHGSPPGPWTRAHRLLLHIDRGEEALPVQLDWQRQDGVHASVAFRSDVSGFHGHLRDSGGTTYEYRGRLAGRWAFPDGLENTPSPALHRFATQEERNGDWHDCHDLRLLIDDEGAPLTAVSWQDQRGGSATIMLHRAPDGAGKVSISPCEKSGFAVTADAPRGLSPDLLRTEWTAADHVDLYIDTKPAAAITSYALTSASDSPESDPLSWTLFGLDAHNNRTPLDRRVGEVFSRRLQTRTFFLVADTPVYDHYLLRIDRSRDSRMIKLAGLRIDWRGEEHFSGHHRRSGQDTVGYRSVPADRPGTPANPPAVPASTGTSRTSAFRAFARSHGVSDDAITRILWSMEPGVHFEYKSPDSVQPGDRVIGYKGGLPEMPLDAEWDAADFFVASFDLAAVPRQPFDDGLPREGHFLLFASTDVYCGEALYVPPGTETAVRLAPVGWSWRDGAPEMPQGLEREALVVSSDAAWDAHGWFFFDEEDGEEPEDEEERMWHAQLVAALEEYASKVGVEPAVDRRANKLRGVQLNPHHTWGNCGSREFQRMREEAVITLRNNPERFDEVYERALKELFEGGPLLNIAHFSQDDVLYEWGDGQVGWMIRRDDLLAGRFDRIEFDWFG
ncbi:DUF1963 domain-containing protein [Microtetraspora sp. AC03309]|uniref:DUF1963 domain-containing protein n=1 Tax=Microtetraspora sp. AC03309 TaxID=2779376 RepID=UPI001E49FF6F|nr:DUF1963 domain-containing protein [Microtetraspora sp. AC03309]MCC5581354.1 DUF1963 domain-containing protein [Microtetraspora sp. AC03309]